jgi:hypothetical protein|tara:strand:- start:1 stop:306 length:306 start_codon:yes stop_codon:yes gene_type:complete
MDNTKANINTTELVNELKSKLISKDSLVQRLEEHIIKSTQSDPEFACSVVSKVPFTLMDQPPSYEIEGVLSVKFLPDDCIELQRLEENIICRAETIVGFYV